MIAEEWSAFLVFDVIIFLLTIMQTLRLRKVFGNVRGITDILLRDGMCIFLFETPHNLLGSLYFVYVIISHHETRLLTKFQGGMHRQCCECNYTVGEFSASYPDRFGTQHIQYRRYRWVMRSLQGPWNVVHVIPFLLECKQNPPGWLYWCVSLHPQPTQCLL